jgi:hypothetical protein
MTRASMSRRERRRRGRPKHSGIDPAEHLKTMLATALQAAWGLSERAAFDLVIAASEAELESTAPHGDSYRLPYATFPGRSSTLRQKRKRGPPPDEIAALITLALRCKDLAAAVRLFKALLVLAGTRGPKAVQQAVRQLLAR